MTKVVTIFLEKRFFLYRKATFLSQKHHVVHHLAEDSAAVAAVHEEGFKYLEEEV